jgi:hypothetical protein
MKKILLFLIVDLFSFSSVAWCREGDCDDSKIVYLSAFEVDPNLLIILDNSHSMNNIAQPTEENGYTYPAGFKDEYIYGTETYEGPFKDELQVIEDGWKVIGERSTGEWICVYFVKNDYSGGLGGTYEANYLNWLLNKAHRESSPFANYGTDRFYRIELKRIKDGYIKGVPRFVSDLTDEKGTAFLDDDNPKWLDYYLPGKGGNDAIQGKPWYNYWYDKPASRMNVARYALCELLRTDLKKINPNWEFKFNYGLMTFRNYFDSDTMIYDKGAWKKATNTTNQWVARGGELLVENGTLTKTHLDNLQSHITTIESRWLTQLGEAVYEAGAYYTGTDTYFCVARGNPPTTHKIIKGTATYIDKSPIKWWCQDSNILLITDGYPTYDTEVPPLNKLKTINKESVYGTDFTDADFDYDGDGKEPPPYQEYNLPESGVTWNTTGSATGCYALMGGSDESWCSHYLDDVVEYYYKQDAVSWDPYSYQQPINTYIVGFGYDSPFLREAAEDAKPDGTYNPNNYLKLKENQHRYFTATSKNKLIKGLMNIMEDIINRMSSSVAVAVSLSTSQSQSEDRIVRAKFDPAGWKGYFEAYKVPYCNKRVNPEYFENGVCKQKRVWEAGEMLGTETADEDDNNTNRDLEKTNEKRMMYTYLKDLPVSENDKRILFTPASPYFPYLKPLLQGTETSLSDEYAKAIMCWTRGEYWVKGTDTFAPGDKNGVFLPKAYPNLWQRDKGWRLFEIVYSTPAVAGVPNAWYGTDSYKGINGFAERFEKRKRVAYVGDNGGSLHCFKLIDDKGANDNWEKGGWEDWAYIPSNLLPKLWYKAEQDSRCRFSMVDLGCVKYDVFFPTDPKDGYCHNNWWRTVLIGGERAGGSQWFCLNITTPDCMTNGPGSKTVFWEYSNREMLGDSYSYPEGGRIKDKSGEKWLAFLTTGPQATGTLPYIIPLDITNGTVYGSPIVVQDGTTRATPPLTSCSALDLKGQGEERGFDDVIDLVYLGDSAGNLWKMKVGSTTDSWKPRILFKTKGSSQPISVSISIAFNENYKPSLFFGSGKYLTKEDAVSTKTQSFYCVTDENPWEDLSLPLTVLGRSNLNKIKFVDEGPGYGQPKCVYGSKTNVFYPEGTRSTTVDKTFWGVNDPKGWFIDFNWAGCGSQTERASEPAIVYSGIVFFTSVIPNTEPCEAGGYGYLHAMDYTKGTIDEEIIVGAGLMTSVFLGKGAPSRPIIDVGSKQLLIQMSEGDVLKSVFIETPFKDTKIVNWGEEGIITCHVCRDNIVHLRY